MHQVSFESPTGCLSLSHRGTCFCWLTKENRQVWFLRSKGTRLENPGDDYGSSWSKPIDNFEGESKMEIMSGCIRTTISQTAGTDEENRQTRLRGKSWQYPKCWRPEELPFVCRRWRGKLWSTCCCCSSSESRSAPAASSSAETFLEPLPTQAAFPFACCTNIVVILSWPTHPLPSGNQKTKLQFW